MVHDSEVEAKNNNGVTVIEVNGGHNHRSATWQSNVHPFAHRTQQRYARKIHVASPVSSSGGLTSAALVNATNSQQPPASSTNNSQTPQHEESLEDSFERILRSADQSIHQAESILCNLRQRSQTLPAATSGLKCVDSEDSDSLGSDIESNIRKLEKTQAKINAALEAFRSIKEDPSPRAIIANSPSLSTMGTSTTAAAASTASARPLTVQKQTSRTAPAQMRALSRRHSFNNNNNNSSSASPRQLYRQTSSSSTASNPRFYEADVESDLNTKDGSWSDSESGFLHPPIKSKLKGLLGTWGRNAKKRSKQHLPLGPTVSDPVPILQPPTASVSDYARKIELLAQDLSNGSALKNNENKSNRRSGSPDSSGGYYTPPASMGGGNEPVGGGANGGVNAGTSSKKSTPESSQRNSVSSESEDLSDSEEQASASVSSTCTSTENGENKNKTKAFYIANELMTSERVYVDVLRLLNVEFRDFLQKARRESKSGLMPDTDYSRLFNNLPELQTLNEVSAC